MDMTDMSFKVLRKSMDLMLMDLCFLRIEVPTNKVTLEKEKKVETIQVYI